MARLLSTDHSDGLGIGCPHGGFIDPGLLAGMGILDAIDTRHSVHGLLVCESADSLAFGQVKLNR
jgi:hypothetical protein